MRIVKNKSIKNVPTDRLHDSLEQIHSMVHTPEGLHNWDQPRRGLYDMGMKALSIRKEILGRGEMPTVEGCRWCSAPSEGD